MSAHNVLSGRFLLPVVTMMLALFPAYLAVAIEPSDLVRHFTRRPVENGWHEVDVRLVGSELVWSNAAGVCWGLNLTNNVLRTKPDSPYGTKDVDMVVSADGSMQVRGLRLNGVFYGAALDPAYARMIPLRDANYRGNDYVISLTGSAILGTKPYEIHFDTGSWDTCIPYGVLNRSNITVLQTNTVDCWGKPADLVRGNLSVGSADGTMEYTASNFVFYARLNAGDDRTAVYGNSIMGAFPGNNPYNGRPSFPLALAQAYSSSNNVGLGIVSETIQGFNKNWDCFNSYLLLGSDPKFTSNLNWRSDLPPFSGYSGYCPYRIPGFGITFSFKGVVKDIVVTGLSATIDTGAPEMVLRVATNNPQRTATYSPFFSSNGAAWWPGTPYSTNALTLVAGQNVRVQFTSDAGKTMHYDFTCVDNYGSPPGNVIVGDWRANVPWIVDGRDVPRTRINLGNTIYFFCPFIFWDVSHNRVGLHDFVVSTDTNGPRRHLR